MNKEKEHSPFKDCPFAFICSDRFCMYYQSRFFRRKLSNDAACRRAYCSEKGKLKN